MIFFSSRKKKKSLSIKCSSGNTCFYNGLFSDKFRRFFSFFQKKVHYKNTYSRKTTLLKGTFFFVCQFEKHFFFCLSIRKALFSIPWFWLVYRLSFAQWLLSIRRGRHHVHLPLASGWVPSTLGTYKLKYRPHIPIPAGWGSPECRQSLAKQRSCWSTPREQQGQEEKEEEDEGQ